MSISLSEKILKVLEEAEGPMTASEIAEKMSGKGNRYAGRHIQVYLKRTLQGRVHQLISGGWVCNEKTETGKRKEENRQESSDQNKSVKSKSKYNEIDNLILKIIKREAPVKAKKVAKNIANGDSRSVSKSKINERLYGALSARVEKISHHRWSLVDQSGNDPNDDSPPDDSRSSESTDKSEETHEKSVSRFENTVPSKKLAQLVYSLMRTQNKPLSVDQVRAHLKSKGHHSTDKDLKKILYENLSGSVCYIVGSGWVLQEKVLLRPDQREVSGAQPVPTSGQASSTKTRSDAKEEASSDEKEERTLSVKSDKQRNAPEQPMEQFSPDGRAANISTKLETAKRIALVLDLSSQPLSVDQIALLIQKCGWSIEETEIRGSLETTLSGFVRSTEDRYYLRDESVDFKKGLTVEKSKDNSNEKLSKEKDVDSTTRARVTGSRYQYLFEKGKEDSASIFSSHIRGGTVKIILNSSHPAFNYLQPLLKDDYFAAGSVKEELVISVKLIIIAWSEVERDLKGRRRELAEELREDWGRVLRRLLSSQEQTQ